MKRNARVGETGELSFVVTQQHIIDFATEGMPEILCTPWLIWFLEHAAREAMFPLLDPGESTVGVQVEVEHIAATPIGERVTCTARVINTDGRQVMFQLSASDEHGKIARGMHKLRVIGVERFAQRLSSRT